MTLDVVVKPESEMATAERADLNTLSRAVYPPEEVANWPGRHLDWSSTDIRVMGRLGQVLVTHVAVVIRLGAHNGRDVTIGGIGGVQTHPDHRGQGYAAAAIGRATELFLERAVDFGLLVCEPELFSYYGPMGWRRFEGTLLTLQKGKTVEFTFNSVMVLPLRAGAPKDGLIDLKGPPW